MNFASTGKEKYILGVALFQALLLSLVILIQSAFLLGSKSRQHYQKNPNKHGANKEKKKSAFLLSCFEKKQMQVKSH